MTVNLIYDGTYDGFLSCIFEAFLHKDSSLQLIRAGDDLNFSLFESIVVKTDKKRADRVEKGIKKLSSRLPDLIYKAWLSELPAIDDNILNVLKLGFKEKSNPASMIYNPDVKALTDAAHKTGAEAHLFLGILRLSHIRDNLYGADIEPFYNILPLIGTHFHMRFLNNRIIIRDLRRGLAIVSESSGWHITELSEAELGPLPQDAYGDIWNKYFIAIANPSRKNLKLQRSFVPLKYRKHITEFTAQALDALNNRP